MRQIKLDDPVHLILDWDGTLTTKDTLSVLAELPKARDARLQLALQTMEPAVRNAKWQDIVDGYKHDYARVYLPRAGGSLALAQWLDSLKPIEYASAKRASDCQFFKGVTTEDIVTTVTRALESGKLALRKGWEDLLSLGLRPACHVTIVSVNWSETFIRWSLFIAASRLPGSRFDKDSLQAYINNMQIYANDIHGLSSPLGSSGRLLGNVRTAREKLDCMERAKAAIADSKTVPRLNVVYVGDSATDFLCLMASPSQGVWLADPEDEDVMSLKERTFAPCKAAELPLWVARDLRAVLQVIRDICWDR